MKDGNQNSKATQTINIFEKVSKRLRCQFNLDIINSSMVGVIAVMSITMPCRVL